MGFFWAFLIAIVFITVGCRKLRDDATKPDPLSKESNNWW